MLNMLNASCREDGQYLNRLNTVGLNMGSRFSAESRCRSTRGCCCRWYHSVIFLRSGNPAHRGHPGERLPRRGGAAAGGHRHIRAHPVRHPRLRHGLKQRRARRLLAAMSPPRGATHALHAHTLKHTKVQGDQAHRRPIPSQFACSVDINRAGRQIEALFLFCFSCLFGFCCFLLLFSTHLYCGRQPD